MSDDDSSFGDSFFDQDDNEGELLENEKSNSANKGNSESISYQHAKPAKFKAPDGSEFSSEQELFTYLLTTG